MDHAHIDNEQLIDRYLLGHLPEEQAEQFEEHYFGCPACQEQLETAKLMQRSVKRLAADDAAAVVVTSPSVWHRLGRLGTAPRLALAAVLLLAVLGPLALQLPPFGRGLDSGIEANPLLLELSPTRGDGADPPSARIRPSAASRSLVLSLLLDQKEFARYAVTLHGPQNHEVWRGEDLVPNAYDALSLTIPLHLLSVGDYSLEVEGLSSGRTPMPEMRFRFRVEPGVE